MRKITALAVVPSVLTHCILVDSLLLNLGVSGLFCHFYSIFDGKSC